MVKSAFVVLSALHGALHFIGVARAFGVGNVGATAQPISKPLGVVWLLAGLVLVVLAGSRALEARWWPGLALGAAIVSQALVFAHWTDARWATIANGLLLVLAAPAVGALRLERDARQQVARLASAAAVSPLDPSVARDRALPPSVARWMQRTNALAGPLSRSVRLHQRGQLRTSPGARWMPFTAAQWFSVQPPGFVWLADVRVAPGLRLAARDDYAEGRGRMQIRLASLVPVVDADGPKIDQGSLLRYLAETIWFPYAAAQPYVSWEELGSNMARATMTYGGVSADGVFTFDDDGDFLRFEAQRYRGEELEHWIVEADPTSSQTFGGYRIPTRARATWRTPEGDWTWLELTVEAVDYADAPSFDWERGPSWTGAGPARPSEQ